MKTIHRASLPQSPIHYNGREYHLEHIAFNVMLSQPLLFDYLQNFEKQGRKIIQCMVLSRRMKGATDLHGKPYQPNAHYFVTKTN